jgi:sensor c-di-GMP phosphodiesterase-like protein
MNSSLFHDRRAAGLLNRVREDVSHLREDIGSLLSHTTKKTLPNGAREIADQAKNHIVPLGAYAASRLRDFRGHPQRQSASWIGGALLVGVLAYGVYSLCQNKQVGRIVGYEPDDEVGG